MWDDQNASKKRGAEMEAILGDNVSDDEDEAASGRKRKASRGRKVAGAAVPAHHPGPMLAGGAQYQQQVLEQQQQLQLQQQQQQCGEAMMPGSAAMHGMMMMDGSGLEVPDDNDDDGSRSQKTQAQIERRRDRNRILARRTRLRKKFFFESLQQQVSDLERENALLKDLVRTNPLIADEAAAVLSTCTTELPAVVTENRARATDLLNAADFTLMNSLQAAQRSFCITDPSLPDNPIVYASGSFLTTTGYGLDAVVGRNCRFLQGRNTDSATVAEVAKGIREGLDTSVTILNYRADGTPFWCQLFVAALRDINQKIVNYVGVQIVVPGPPAQVEGTATTTAAATAATAATTTMSAGADTGPAAATIMMEEEQKPAAPATPMMRAQPVAPVAAPTMSEMPEWPSPPALPAALAGAPPSESPPAPRGDPSQMHSFAKLGIPSDWPDATRGGHSQQDAAGTDAPS